MRVKPIPDELMRISFKLKSGKRISGKVIDISLGGIGAELFSNANLEQLVPGNLIEHLLFTANHKEIDVDVKIINKKDKFLAIKFTHFYKDSYENLMKYIKKKINE